MDHSPCAREQQNARREHQHREHHHLNFLLLDLLAQVFGSSAHHQPGNENRQNGEHQHAVKPGPHAAEHHFAQFNVDQWDESPERRKTIVHAIHRAAARIGRHRGEQRRIRDAKAYFLAFHVSARLGRGRLALDPHRGQNRISILFRGVADHHACQKQDAHGGE